jgi:hypothetical protein
MADKFRTAVVQETVSQIVSGVFQKYKEHSNDKERIERLEMVQIKLEAALELSYKWQITDATALQRWQKKLKRVSQECDATLRECKRRIVQEQEEERTTEDGARAYTFAKRVARAGRSIISLFSHDQTSNSSASASIVRRFERFADGASEFLRFVEFGGTPCQYMFFDPLIRHLFAGRKLEHRIDRGDSRHFLFLIRPFSSSIEHGVEARLLLIHKDASSVEENFVLGVMLQLSESTDIVGTAVRSLELFTADHAKRAVDAARGELTQLATQDFRWVPYADSNSKQHWHKIHGLLTQWFRPNPECCKLHNKHRHRNSPGSGRGSSDADESTSKLHHHTCLDQVIQVYLQHHVVVSDSDHCSRNWNRKAVMKHGVLFSPHCSPEDSKQLVPASGTGSSSAAAAQVINVEQLENIMFPTATDCLSLSAQATVYQMLWKTRHGAAYLLVGRAGTALRRSTRRARQNSTSSRAVDTKWERTQVVADFLRAWLAHTPSRLQGSFLDWIKEDKEMHFARLGDCRRYY